MTDHVAIAARVRQDRETGTPGPWHQGTGNHMGIDYTDPRSGTCWNVAYVHSHCGHPIDGSSANARRIAALPDLEAAYLDLYDEVRRLRAALVDHNDLLRSANQIAKREGIDGQIASTNWDAYYNRVSVVLKRHHAIANDARAALKGPEE